ncbi:MAG: hypothetical protein QOI21_4898 [Actinomycetota bacterium]|jgi:hypothetical protein|nr:hypothetical protein [Actinomycetota bacterium]
MAPARTPRLVFALCALLAAVACGVQVQASSAPAALGPVPEVQEAVKTPPDMLKFGVGHTFADGVAITVSVPKSFQPSPTAYPASARAAAFEIEVLNSGPEPYRLSGFTVAATVGGTQAIQVVDSTQGFTGVIDAGKDVAPGVSVRMNLAFAVPPQPAELRMVLRPDTASPVSAVYCGSA